MDTHALHRLARRLTPLSLSLALLASSGCGARTENAVAQGAQV
jgi:hypothetical protein